MKIKLNRENQKKNEPMETIYVLDKQITATQTYLQKSRFEKQ